MSEMNGIDSRETDLSTVAREAQGWIRATFGTDRCTAQLVKHLREEVDEVEAAAGAELALELADVVLLTLNIADAHSIDLGAALRRKLEINKRRTFKLDPATGLFKGSKEAP